MMEYFILALLVVTFVAFVVDYISWHEWLHTYGRWTWIDFESFKKWYYVNPDRWEVSHDFVAYHDNKDRPFDFINVNFKYRDYHRYLRWYEKLQKTKAQQKIDGVLKDILVSVQADILDLKNKSRQQIKDGLGILEEMVNVDPAKVSLDTSILRKTDEEVGK